MNGVGTVFRKEALEVLRDRKTLIFMLALPILLIPLFGNLTLDFVMKAERKAMTEELPYALVGEAQEPELAAAFTEEKGFARKEVENVEAIPAAIEAETIKFALVLPEVDRATEPLQVQLHYNNASSASKVKHRVGEVLKEYEKQMRLQSLEGLGVSTPEARELILDPVDLQEVGTADMREVIGENVGGMLPYLFIAFCFLGSLYPAIDVGAGEKERGTLETLLLAPVRRHQIVLGKFLVIFAAGVTAAFLSLASLGVWLATKGGAVGGIIGEVLSSIGATDLALIALMLLPTAAVFAALLLSISIYAKSFKEAQSYAAPLQILMILPAFVAMLPGVELNWNTALIPVTNISLAIKELIKGTMDYPMLVAILGSSTAIALGLLYFSTKWFEREEVLFRQ